MPERDNQSLRKEEAQLLSQEEKKSMTAWSKIIIVGRPKYSNTEILRNHKWRKYKSNQYGSVFKNMYKYIHNCVLGTYLC